MAFIHGQTDTHKKPILLEQDITWHVWCLPLLTSYKTTVMVGWVTSEMVEDRTEVRRSGEHFLYQFGNEIGRSDRSEQLKSSRRIQSRFSRMCSSGPRKTWKILQCRQPNYCYRFGKRNIAFYSKPSYLAHRHNSGNPSNWANIDRSLFVCTILMPIFVRQYAIFQSDEQTFVYLRSNFVGPEFEQFSCSNIIYY